MESSAAAAPHMVQDSSPHCPVPLHQPFPFVKPRLQVPRGGCPAYGRSQLDALAGATVGSLFRSSHLQIQSGRVAAAGTSRVAARPSQAPRSAPRIPELRDLRSLHIERACVCPFSASSVVFPRRLCNGGEHSSPCASPEAPCGSARSPYRLLPGPSSPSPGAAERFLRGGRLAASARPAPASFRRIIRSLQAPTE